MPVSPTRPTSRRRSGGRVYLIPTTADGRFFMLVHHAAGRADIVTLPAALMDRHHRSPETAARYLASTLLYTVTCPRLIAVLPATRARAVAYIYSVGVAAPTGSTTPHRLGARWQAISIGDVVHDRVDLRPRDVMPVIAAHHARSRRHRLGALVQAARSRTQLPAFLAIDRNTRPRSAHA
jgi:hypothetical protein